MRHGMSHSINMNSTNSTFKEFPDREMNARNSRKRRNGCSRNRRRRGQYGGAGEAYTFGASVDPSNPSLGNAAEVIRFPSCENAVRPGTITSYTPTGLPGMRGGRRTRRARSQKGGRYAFDGQVVGGNGVAISGAAYTGCGAGADRVAAHPGQGIEGQMSAPLPVQQGGRRRRGQKGGNGATQRGGAVPLVGAAIDAGGTLLQGVGGAVGGILGTTTHIAGQGAATALGTAGGVLGSGLNTVGSGIRDASAYAGNTFASGASSVAGTFRGGRRGQRGGGNFPGADLAATGVGLLGSGLSTVGQGVGNILGTSAQVVGNTTGGILSTSGTVLGSGLQTVGSGISNASGSAAQTVSAAASRAAAAFVQPMRGGYVAPVGQTGTLPVDAMVYQAPRSGWAVLPNPGAQPGSGVYSINVPYGSAPQVSSSCQKGGRRSRKNRSRSRRNSRRNSRNSRNRRNSRNSRRN